MPAYKQGDVVEIDYYYSLSEKKTNTVKGLCIGRAKPNALHQTLTLGFWAEDTIVKWNMKTLAPTIKQVKVVAEGSKGL